MSLILFVVSGYLVWIYDGLTEPWATVAAIFFWGIAAPLVVFAFAAVVGVPLGFFLTRADRRRTSRIIRYYEDRDRRGDS